MHLKSWPTLKPLSWEDQRVIEDYPIQWPSWYFSTRLLYIPQVCKQLWAPAHMLGSPSTGPLLHNKPCAGMCLSMVTDGAETRDECIGSTPSSPLLQPGKQWTAAALPRFTLGTWVEAGVFLPCPCCVSPALFFSAWAPFPCFPFFNSSTRGYILIAGLPPNTGLQILVSFPLHLGFFLCPTVDHKSPS
jgi:hypothetical protein